MTEGNCWKIRILSEGRLGGGGYGREDVLTGEVGWMGEGKVDWREEREQVKEDTESIFALLVLRKKCLLVRNYV